MKFQRIITRHPAICAILLGIHPAIAAGIVVGGVGDGPPRVAWLYAALGVANVVMAFFLVCALANTTSALMAARVRYKLKTGEDLP